MAYTLHAPGRLFGRSCEWLSSGPVLRWIDSIGPFNPAEVTSDSDFDGGFANHPGIRALSAVFAILGGIITAVFLIPMLRLLWVHDPAATGLAAGAAGSGIAEPTMVPLGLVQAAFAGVAIGLNGLMTAAIAPLMARALARF